MNRTPPRLSERPPVTGSLLSNNCEFVVLDCTRELRRFLDLVDGQVEDLSYNVEQVVLQFSNYRYERTTDGDIDRMADALLQNRWVGNMDDSYIVAEAAIGYLYVSLHELVCSHGYQMAAIHRVQLYITRNRMPSCRLLLAAL